MLHIERLGKGRNVILLHGFLESSTMWSYIDWLGVRQIRIDLPGHGKSPHVDCEDIVSMAELVNRSLSPDERREPIVVGHSMGGYVALELIKYFENPRLILINSNFWKDSEQKRGDRVRVAEIVEHHKDAFIAEAIPNLFAEPSMHSEDINKLISEAENMKWEAIASASLAMRARSDNSEIVKKLGMDCLIIQGQNDSVVPMTVMNQRALLLDQNPRIVDSGHMSHIENPKVVQQLIDEFVG